MKDEKDEIDGTIELDLKASDGRVVKATVDALRRSLRNGEPFLAYDPSGGPDVMFWPEGGDACNFDEFYTV